MQTHSTNEYLIDIPHGKKTEPQLFCVECRINLTRDKHLALIWYQFGYQSIFPEKILESSKPSI
jgi:hypothetical protein